MATFLFDEIVFGPVNSRRLGISLGVNLLPTSGKICSFDCIYCECGLNKDNKPHTKIPTKEAVLTNLESVLAKRAQENLSIDYITFAGNGEPTLHPDFADIIRQTLHLRERFFPHAKVAVLSNATEIHRQEVIDALLLIDDNILKLDSAIPNTIKLINQPQKTFDHDLFYKQLKPFKGKFILQTMFLRGTIGDVTIDNTTPQELEALLAIIPQLAPRSIQIYSIARDTPVSGLKAIEKTELKQIAEKIKALGFPVDIA